MKQSSKINKKKVFIIGINGKVAQRHIKAWKKLGASIYGCGSDKDYKKLLKKPKIKYDIVDICTPNYLHYEMIKYANRLKYNVICEKPLCITEDQAKELLKLKGKIGIVYQFRYNPKIIKLKRDIEKGVYGDIKMVVANYFRWRDDNYYKKWEGNIFKSGGGVLFNVCIHYLDLLQWIFGYPTDVKGFEASAKGYLGIEDYVCAVLKFPNNVIGSINLTTHANPPKHFELSIFGTQGSKTIQLRHNEYHYRFFEEFIKDGDYVNIFEAYKSFRIAKDIYKSI